MSRGTKEPPWARNEGYQGAFKDDDGSQPLGTGSRGWARTGQGPAGNETSGGSWGNHRAPGPSDVKKDAFNRPIKPKPGRRSSNRGNSGGSSRGRDGNAPAKFGDAGKIRLGFDKPDKGGKQWGK